MVSQKGQLRPLASILECCHLLLKEGDLSRGVAQWAERLSAAWPSVSMPAPGCVLEAVRFILPAPELPEGPAP